MDLKVPVIASTPELSVHCIGAGTSLAQPSLKLQAADAIIEMRILLDARMLESAIGTPNGTILLHTQSPATNQMISDLSRLFLHPAAHQSPSAILARLQATKMC